MCDTRFSFDDAEKAIRRLRRLFTEKSTVEQRAKNGKWDGPNCGPPGRRKVEPTFTRSWLGTYDAP
jgi:hypothetical protein